MSRGLSVSEVVDEWRGNPRLRIGGWVIVAVIAAYVFLFLSDVEKKIKNDYLERAAGQERLFSLVQQKEWIGRAESAKSMCVQLQNRLWRANSRGLAQAKTQNHVDNLIKKWKLTDARIQVGQAGDLSGSEGVWEVPVKIDALFDPYVLFRLLKDIETDNRLSTIGRLDVVNNRKPVFVLEFMVYFQANST